MNTIIQEGNAEDFFKRGRGVAQLADKGEPIPNQRIISFENRDDLIDLITKAKLNLILEVKSKPGSIADLSARLKRDRSSVARDIVKLAKFGLLIVEEKPFPGHGRMKEVRAASENLLLSVL